MLFIRPKPDKYPPYFYKYIPFTKQRYISDILAYNKLYFSFPKQFTGNDAYDCRAFNFVIRNRNDMEFIIRQEIETKYSHLSRHKKRSMLRANLVKYGNPNAPFYTERIATMNRVFKEEHDRARIAILCLTDSPERIDMWNAYIADNKGVCIQLRSPVIVKHLFSTIISASHINPHLNWLRDVRYVSEPIDIPWSDFSEAEHLSAFITQLYTKLSDFAFEQEWRFTIYECIEQSITFPEEMVERVFVAPGTTVEQRELINFWNCSRKRPFAIEEANIPMIRTRPLYN